ncbi:MAG: DUF58 domain-containing protein, partial [Burkholderiales bacterium]
RWKPSGVLPGAYRGMHGGHGNEVRAVVPLEQYPDPRRLDLRMTLRDPLARLWVRDFKQNAALKVFVLADVSASMRFQGRRDKFALLREIAGVLAQSAWRAGDRFGMYAADENLVPELCLPARVNRGAADWLKLRFARFIPKGKSARGLLQAAARLPEKRALVFLISDFCWPEKDLADILKSLAHHDVAPLVLRDPVEADDIPAHGIASLYDLETRRREFVWVRPSLNEKLRAEYRGREALLTRACWRFARAPFFVRDDFDPIALTRYFMEAA